MIRFEIPVSVVKQIGAKESYQSDFNDDVGDNNNTSGGSLT